MYKRGERFSGEFGTARHRADAAIDARVAAENAIERALTVLEQAREPSIDQLSDLADAIDSLSEGAFDLAADLATGAQRSLTLPRARRPQSLARTLPDLKAAFESTRRFLKATPLKHADD